MQKELNTRFSPQRLDILGNNTHETNGEYN